MTVVVMALASPAGTAREGTEPLREDAQLCSVSGAARKDMVDKESGSPGLPGLQLVQVHVQQVTVAARWPGGASGSDGQRACPGLCRYFLLSKAAPAPF